MPACKKAAYLEFCKDALEAAPPGESIELEDGRVLILPGPLPKGLEKVRVLTAGIYAGDMLGSRFQPSHALAMAAGVDWRRNIRLLEEEQQAYLHGQVLAIEGGGKGWCRVEGAGYPLGLGKMVEGTLKNHLPKGLRLL